jgi:tetratricopeptide (TPR) repeat protein
VRQPRHWILSAVVCLLGACASQPGSPPVTERDSPPPVQRDESPAPPPSEPRYQAATTTLLAQADAAAQADDLGSAIAYLERAVRIEPRDPQLWIRLSQAHVDNEDYPAATQHARKAIALAGQDPAASRAAWLQLANVKQAEGNTSEANSIRRRYRHERG